MSHSLFKELKRRNVYKVGVAYLILSWVVVQVSSAAVPALHLPPWINTAVFLFGAIGFPFALFFAWEFELTPDGVKRESEIAPENSVAAHTGRKLDFIIIGLLIIALGYFIYESRFAPLLTYPIKTESASENNQPIKLSNAIKGASIAVLPFVNMSSDQEQEYFSDGISEEILNVLAKIPELHVTSRSSAFFYKDTKINISEVAAKLGVKNILEGSVRKSGNRIRITAQLIDASSDKHLWSETYDRELTDIFAIQDEISAAIVKALKSKLGLEANIVARDMSKVNLEAHNEYLKGRFYIENRNQTDIEKALIHFDNAITLAPDYAPAWMGKAWANHFLSEANYGNLPREVSFAKAMPAIEKALQLDPNLPEAHGVMGLLKSNNLNPENGIIHFKRALELNPNYADVMTWYGLYLDEQPTKRLALFRKAIQLNPMSILSNNLYGHDLLVYGRINEAREIFQHMLTINPSHHQAYGRLAQIQLVLGKYAESIMAYETQINNSPEYLDAKFEIAYVLSTLGFTDKAASYMVGTSGDAAKHWFKGNLDLHISQVRTTYPRNENDSLGYFIRGLIEAKSENYNQASKYFNLTSIGEVLNERIFSSIQTGNKKKAQALLKKANLILDTWEEAGAQYLYSSELMQPIALRKMELAFLAGDIDKAITNLKKAMKQNYIVNFEYLAHPMYKKLRAHPDWPAIIAESNKRVAVQRELYLKLVAKDDKTTL